MGPSGAQSSPRPAFLGLHPNLLFCHFVLGIESGPLSPSHIPRPLISLFKGIR